MSTRAQLPLAKRLRQALPGISMVLLGGCLAATVSAQIPEWQANTIVVGSQAGSEIVETPTGDLVMVWSSQGLDGSSFGIALRRFSAEGTPLDAVERQVNAFTTDSQSGPRLAIDASGEMVVAWRGNSAADDTGIVARRVGTDGTPLGDEIQVNTSFSGFHINPRVARAAGGEFAVIWFDSVPDQVVARRFSADGTPQGDPFGVSRAGLPSNSGGQDLAYLPNGELLAVWGDDDQIFVQRYDTTGATVGMPVLVSQPIVSNDFPSLEIAPDGTYLVVWRGFETGNQNLIVGQRMSATDTLEGPNVVFNTLLPRPKGPPAVARESDGGYRVVWMHQGTEQGSGFDLYSRRVDAGGQLVGAEEVRATSTTIGEQNNPTLVALATGGSLLVWNSDDQDGLGVFTDMPTTEPLFADDFESGDTTRWYVTGE